VEGGAKKRHIGGDVEGENIVHSLKPGEHCVLGKKRHMNVGCHAWLPNWGKKGLEIIKGRKVGLINRWILQKDHRRIGVRLFKRLKQGNKNIQAPKAVMLNDGKKSRGRGRPWSRGRRTSLIIHYRDEPEDREGQEKGLAPPGRDDHRNRE